MDEMNNQNNELNNITETNTENAVNENGGHTDAPVNYYNSAGSQQEIQPIQNTVAPKKKKNWVLVTLCIVLSVLVGVSSGYVAADYLIKKNNEETRKLLEEQINNSSNGGVNISIDETVNSAIEAVAKKVNPSVVGIRTTAAVQNFFGGSSEESGEGSGVIYSTDGYIITNYHVIKSAAGREDASIDVFFSTDAETAVKATVVGYNISYDLAVIKVEKTGLTAIEIADVSKLAVGQYVAAIGSPGGLEYMGSVSYGIISGLDRTISSPTSTDTVVSLIQTDAAINPGNSGGALVNTNGQLVGINSSKIVSESFEGMGFAIPADTVKEICDKIISKENDPDPYIGITLSQTWTAQLLKSHGYPAGAVVNSVVEGGPSYQAGIRSGDIITEFNGKAVEDFEELAKIISKCTPGESVTVKIYRSGGYYSTSIKIGSNNAQ